MDQIIIQITLALASYTIDATFWMVEYWYWSLPVLFIEYVLLMEIWGYARSQWWGKYYRVAFGVFFLPQDWVVNIGFCSVLFFDPPASLFEVVTARMKRYKRTYLKQHPYNLSPLQRYRLKFAVWLCKHLSRHDPRGEHC